MRFDGRVFRLTVISADIRNEQIVIGKLLECNFSQIKVRAGFR